VATGTRYPFRHGKRNPRLSNLIPTEHGAGARSAPAPPEAGPSAQHDHRDAGDARPRSLPPATPRGAAGRGGCAELPPEMGQPQAEKLEALGPHVLAGRRGV